LLPPRRRKHLHGRRRSPCRLAPHFCSNLCKNEY
jgi:hypothetical protein